MTVNLRLPKYCEHIEDVPYELQENIAPRRANQQQKKTAYRFIVDSTNDVNPTDFYNAYLEIDFRIVRGDNNVLVAADKILQ